MDKPHLKIVFGNWWCFNSRKQAQQFVCGDPRIKAWYGFDAINAFKRWERFNRMKP